MKHEKRVLERQELKQSTVLNKSTIERTWKVNANVGLRDTESSSNIFFLSLFCINLHHTVIIQKEEYATRDVMLAVIIHSFQTLTCFNKGRSCWIIGIYSWSLENVF